MKEIPQNTNEQFALMVIGQSSPTILHNSYESAELEAKRLTQKMRQTTLILKVIAKAEMNDVTITKL